MASWAYWQNLKTLSKRGLYDRNFSTYNGRLVGLPYSPSGGNAHRCMDTSGRGVSSVIGDAALGSHGQAYTVSGAFEVGFRENHTGRAPFDVSRRHGDFFKNGELAAQRRPPGCASGRTGPLSLPRRRHPSESTRRRARCVAGTFLDFLPLPYPTGIRMMRVVDNCTII